MTIEIDALSLLALKVKENVFDLSSGQYNISIRDQIVRGQLLVRDLLKADPKATSILIVGAGVVGIAAAERALLDNDKLKVCVIDKEKLPFSLQRGVVARHVGPFMYEWPAATHSDQRYPPADQAIWGTGWPSALRWSSKTPISANHLCKSLDRWVVHLRKTFAGRLRLEFGIDGSDAVAELTRFVAQVKLTHQRYMASGGAIGPSKFVVRFLNTHRSAIPLNVDYVLLACGPGKERVALTKDIKGLEFWKNDTLLSRNTAKQRIAIFGGGDGALQDVLRAITGRHHPLSVIKTLITNPDVKLLMESTYGHLLTAESQARLLQNWTTDPSVDARLDAACQKAAQQLAKHPCIRQRLALCVRRRGPYRRGKVTHVVVNSWFDRAYMLNRFLVHLLHECQQHVDWPADRIRYELLLDTKVLQAAKNKTIFSVQLSTGGAKARWRRFHLIVVRHGLNPGSMASAVTVTDAKGDHPAQMIQLTALESKQRASLGKVQLPFLVP